MRVPSLSQQLALIVLLLLTVPMTFALNQSAATHPKSSLTRQAESTPPPEASSNHAPGHAVLQSSIVLNDLTNAQLSDQSLLPFLTLQNETASSHPPVGSAGTNGLAQTTPSSLTIVNRFQGLNQTQSTCGSCRPPDVQVAAGPDHVVEMVNLAGEVFTRQGLSVKIFALADFFGTGSDSISDPKVLYDSLSGYWFASIVDVSTGDVILAVSTTSSPLAGWNTYTLPTGGRVPDQPIIGVSDDKLVVSANIFTLYPFTYYGAQYWVLDKLELMAGLQTADYSMFGPDPGLFSVHPVQSLSSTTTEYMVSSGLNPSNTLEVFSVTGQARAVTVKATNLTVSPITLPPPAAEPGGLLQVDTGDARVLDAAWYQNKLWLTLSDGCIPTGDNQTRTCVRLTQIDTSSMTPLQDFDYGSQGEYYVYPALRIDAKGDIAVLYGYSSIVEYPSLAITGRTPGDPPESLRQPSTVITGSALDSSLRYGDYFGAALDPSDQTLVWTAGEYHTSSGGTCGSSGACWSTYIASARVENYGFTLSAYPAFQTVPSGMAASSNITISSLGGFIGTVALSATVPAVTAKVVLSKATLSVSQTSPAYTTVTVTTTTSVSPGPLAVSLTGTSGGNKVSAVETLGIIGFSMSSPQSRLSLPPSTFGLLNLTFASAYGFSGPVLLRGSSNPNGLASSFTPSTVQVSPHAIVTSLTNVTSLINAVPGAYTLNATATSVSQSHSVTFLVSIGPLRSTIDYSNTFTGVTVHATGSINIDAPSYALTLSGQVQVVATMSSTGTLLMSKSYTIDRMPIGELSPGNYRTRFLIDVPLTPVPFTVNVIETVKGGSQTSTFGLTRALDINQDGLVDSPDIAVASAAYGCSVGSQCYDPRADLNADGIVDVFDISLLSAYYGALDIMPDFAAAMPSRVVVDVSNGANSSPVINSLNGFDGLVNFTSAVVSGSSMPPTVTFNASSVHVPAGGTVPFLFSVSASRYTAPGNYPVIITVSSSTETHAYSLSVSVQDYSLAANPNPVSGSIGIPATLTLTTGSINGFAGSVILSTSSMTAGLSVAITPSDLNLTASAPYALAAITVISQVRDGSFVIAGRFGSLVRTTTIVVKMSDFSMGATPTSMRLSQGATGYSTVTLDSLNGFTGTISLSATLASSPATNSPPTLFLTSTSIPLTPVTPGLSYLRISTTSGTALGIYTISLVGSSTGLAHTVTITVTVTT